MDIKEQNDIEFLDVYPTKNVKLPLNPLILIVNIGLFLTGALLSWALIFNNNVSYALETKKLYEVVNNTENEDKTMLFKGNATNNYVKYNNMIWRIVKVNSTGTITLILDETINKVSFNINDDFDVKEYLNTKFLNELDKSKLVNNMLCADNTESLVNITCNEIDNNYVSLLDINSFASTIDNGESFVANDSEKVWLTNGYNNEEAWHTLGSKISHSKKDAIYDIKPVITLNNEVLFESGSGSKSDPYIIKSDKLSVGSTVKLGDDVYDVYETNENEIKLMLQTNLESNYAFSGNYEDIFSYLTIVYYKNLPYKDLILDSKWEKVNIKNNKVTYEEYTAKVGIPNIFDFKITTKAKDYYTLTELNNYILVINDQVIYGTKNKYHYLRPTIAISKETASKLVERNGIYMLEEE